MTFSHDVPVTVLVLGATGKVGRRLVPRLRLGGHDVRAASRSGSTRFDWARPSTWEPALAGTDAVYVVPPTAVGPVHRLVALAEELGVRHLVLQSGHRADRWGDSPFGRDMLAAEEAVRGSRLAWTVLRPSNFAQNFDEELFHAPLLAGELALPAGDVPEAFVDVEDVAAVAAAVLGEPGRHVGRTYELTGPRGLTFAEAVDLVGRASGLAPTYRRTTPEEYTAALLEQGLDEDAARSVTAMYDLLDRGAISGVDDGVAAVLGREPRPFEEYVLRGAAAGRWTPR